MLSFQLNNGAPGVKLQFVDLCRNLVCCQFPGSEEEKIAGYHRYWAPVEALAMERAAVGGGGSSGGSGGSVCVGSFLGLLVENTGTVLVLVVFCSAHFRAATLVRGDCVGC